MDFSDLQRLFDTLSDYRIDESRCTYLISSKSHCDACIRSCPLSCIQIRKADKSIDIDYECVKCGICSWHCPTHAIKMKLDTWDYIIGKLESHEISSLGCRKNTPSKNAYFTNFCIGSLSNEQILYLLIKAPELLDSFDNTKCDTCNLKNGYNIFDKRKRDFQSKLEGIQLQFTKNEKSLSASNSKNDFDQNKRAFLKSIFALPAFLRDSETSSKELTTENASSCHPLSQTLFEDFPELYEILDYRFPLPSGQNTCSGCTACVQLCPNHALHLSGTSLSLSPDLCCGCELCCNVCYDKAIHMGSISFEDFKKATLKIY